MSTDDRDDEAAAVQGGLTHADHEQGSTLPRTLQEHLAQKLRSAYQELSDKPAFLGDPTLPIEFEYHLARLEAVERNRLLERVRNQGLEAVKSALQDIVAGPLDPEPSEPGKGRGN